MVVEDNAAKQESDMYHARQDEYGFVTRGIKVNVILPICGTRPDVPLQEHNDEQPSIEKPEDEHAKSRPPVNGVGINFVPE